jgi:hypothetical protein
MKARGRASWWLFGAWAIATGLAVGGYLHWRNANILLRAQIAAASGQREEIHRLRDDNQRLQAVLAQARGDEGVALQAIHQEVQRAGAEVSELERQAEERYIAKRERDRKALTLLTANRDLTKGPVLVENCGNVGRATPVDAFQTLVWAGVKGDDDLVASMIMLDGKARAAVAALLDRMPERVREKYSTPEKLAALVFADLLANLAAVQVVNEKRLDAAHVQLTIGRMSDKTVDVVMELGPAGWQVMTADRKLFDQFKAKLAGGTTTASK